MKIISLTYKKTPLSIAEQCIPKSKPKPSKYARMKFDDKSKKAIRLQYTQFKLHSTPENLNHFKISKAKA